VIEHSSTELVKSVPVHWTVTERLVCLVEGSRIDIYDAEFLAKGLRPYWLVDNAVGSTIRSNDADGESAQHSNIKAIRKEASTNNDVT